MLRGNVVGHPESSALFALHPSRNAGFVELAAGGPRWRVDPAPDIPAVDLSEVEPIDYDQLGGGLQRTRELISEAGLGG